MGTKTGLADRLKARWTLRTQPRSERGQADAVRRGVATLAAVRPARPPGLTLPEQPFDAHLLALSPLYRRNRKRFLESGGSFRAALLSSPRSLSSPALLSPRVEYSPVESELIWAATDPRQTGAAGRRHLLELRTFVSSLYHEQSHRILWRHLPPAPRAPEALRRYLNFAESLVITLDMALGDELGPELALLFYLCGATYDPGTGLHAEGVHGREYRTYLQAALQATYLNLEGFDPARIPLAIRALFPGLGPLAERAARRSGNLDRAFIGRTNLVWQRRHRAAVLRELGGGAGTSLALPADPLDNRLQYLFAESWFARFGL